MKIASVEVSGLRGKSFTVLPEKFNVYFAPNGSGKTTIQDGIRYALTGYLPKNVAEKPESKTSLDSGLNFGRGKSCTIGGKKVAAKALDEAVVNEVGVPIEDIKVTSSSDVLLAKKPEDFLGILTRFIPEDMDLATLKSYFSALDAEKEAFLDKYFPAMPDKFSIHKIDEAADQLTAEKKMVNAELTQKKKVLESLANTPVPKRDIADIEKDINDMTLAKNSATDFARKQASYEAALKRKEAQEEKIKDLESKIDSFKGIKPVTPEQLKAIDAQREKADRVRVETTRDLTTINNNIAMFQKTLANLDKPVCPISSKLICTTDKTGIKSEMTNAITSNEKLKENMERNLKSATDQITRLASQKAELDAVTAKLREKANYESMLDMLKKSPVEIPEAPVQVTAGTDVDAVLAELARERNAFLDYKRISTLEKEVSLLQGQYKSLTDLVNSIKDKGEVKGKVIEHYFGIFEQACNVRASQFAPGYEVKFVAENGVEVLLKTPKNGAFVPVDAISNGERLIGAFIIMDMLNQLNNTGLCFIDNVESLDHDSLVALRKLIEDPTFADSYDHIFVMGVDHKEVVDAFDGMHKVA